MINQFSKEFGLGTSFEILTFIIENSMKNNFVGRYQTNDSAREE